MKEFPGEVSHWVVDKDQCTKEDWAKCEHNIPDPVMEWQWAYYVERTSDWHLTDYYPSEEKMLKDYSYYSPHRSRFTKFLPSERPKK